MKTPSESVPTKTEAMSLPYPGQAVSKSTSKSQTFLPNRASELGTNTVVSSTWSLKDEQVTESTKHPLYIEADSCGATVDNSPQSSCSSGTIYTTESTTSVMTTLSRAAGVASRARGEKSPKKHSTPHRRNQPGPQAAKTEPTQSSSIVNASENTELLNFYLNLYPLESVNR